jgi:hypothetical protein
MTMPFLRLHIVTIALRAYRQVVHADVPPTKTPESDRRTASATAGECCFADPRC